MLSIIQAAGWPIWPLIFASFLALALVIERLFSLRTSRIAPPKLLSEALKVSRQAVPGRAVVDQLAQNSELGEVLASGLLALGANPRCSEEDLRATMEASGREVAHRMERYLSALATIASAAPLLGLLGTVIGMVELFGAFTSTGHDVAQFARGISVALYNTAMGIVVAVPSMIFYRHFRAKVNSLVVEMELEALKLVELIHGERT